MKLRFYSLVSTVLMILFQAVLLSADVVIGSVAASVNQHGSAIVWVQDKETGIPLLEDGTLLHEGLSSGSKLNHDIIDKNNQFSISLPEVEANLVAQRWVASEENWPNWSLTVFSGLPKYGAQVELLGRLDSDELKNANGSTVTITPQGSATVRIKNVPNEDLLIMISRGKPSLDRIYGWSGWQGAFLEEMIGFSWTVNGEAVFTNVPEGPVYICGFANDNRPGFASTSLECAEGGEYDVSLHIVAGWSNGWKLPPGDVKVVYDKIIENAWTMETFEDVFSSLTLHPQPGDLINQMKDESFYNEEVLLPDGSKARQGDVVTAFAYIKAFGRIGRSGPGTSGP